MFDKYGIENFNIYLLENCNCNDINELRAKGGEYIKRLKCINKSVPGTWLEEQNKIIIKIIKFIIKIIIKITKKKKKEIIKCSRGFDILKRYSKQHEQTKNRTLRHVLDMTAAAQH